MNKQEIIKLLDSNSINVINERRVNDCGDKLDLSNGAIINIFDNGNVYVQGKNTEIVKSLIFGANSNNTAKKNNKVFVVYGHDMMARTQLEAMLRRWDMEPLILDQLPSSSNTVIEKLEEYTKQVEFGIVLATPDDMGYAAQDGPERAKCRVRQNVVLELGMLLASTGRDKVAILLKTKDNFEKPSDIDGLIYIPFEKNVEEAKLSLAKEMEKHGYKLDISKL
ncbi:MAG: nucleotide-binding protein [Alistipes sp.]|jgi:predicted nucleotide-binding protein|nr:nucleotide-binding protein [Alistipes sp.]